MKYKKEYQATTNREEFINLLLKTYPEIKKATALRRYYDLRKSLGKTIEVEYTQSEMQKPGYTKMFLYNDMKRYKKNITREYLRKYGFNEYEINWLEKNG